MPAPAILPLPTRVDPRLAGGGRGLFVSGRIHGDFTHPAYRRPVEGRWLQVLRAAHTVTLTSTTSDPQVTLRLPINPDSYEISAAPEYVQHKPLFLSHSVPNYVHTASWKIRFPVVVDDVVIRLKRERDTAEMLLNKLLALTTPVARAATPPLLILSAGRLATFFGYISEDPKPVITRQWPNGQPRAWTADVTVTEYRRNFRTVANTLVGGLHSSMSRALDASGIDFPTAEGDPGA